MPQNPQPNNSDITIILTRQQWHTITAFIRVQHDHVMKAIRRDILKHNLVGDTPNTVLLDLVRQAEAEITLQLFRQEVHR